MRSPVSSVYLELVAPSLCIVLVLLFVEAAKQTTFEFECSVAQKQRIGMGHDIVLVVQLVNEDMVDHGVEKRCVGTWANARIHIGRRGRPGESRIDVDDDCPILLGLTDPLEGHGVVLRHVAAFHQDRLAMLQVNPVVGHRPPPECSPQTGDRGAVSKSRLVLDVCGAEQARRFLEQVAFLVGILSAAHESKGVGPVDRNLCVT